MSVHLLSGDVLSCRRIGNMKSYSKTMLIISSVVSVGVFILVSLVSQNGVFGILAAFFSFVILIPKVLWQFTLNRIGELSKAIQGKE